MRSVSPVEAGVAALTRRVAVPVAALLLLGLVVISFVMWSAARDRDKIATNHSLRIVSAALDVVQRQLRRTINDYAIWDDAMQHLHVDFDVDWAAQNVGRYVANDYDIHTVLVVAADDRIVFDYEPDGLATRPPAFIDLDPTVRRLVMAARTASPAAPNVSGFVRHHGRAHIAAASVINWYDSDRKIPAGRASVLVFARSLQSGLIAEMADSYQVPGPRFEDGAAVHDGDLAVPLASFGGGEAVGFLAWRPDLPGSAFLRDLAVPVGAAIAVMVILLASIMLNARRAGRQLDVANAELRAASEHLEATVAERTRALEAEVRERREVETALRVAEARYRSSFENAVEGIFQMTPDGRFLAANPALASMLGFASSAELIAAPTNPLFANSDQRESFFAKMRDGPIRDFGSEACRRDGTVLWVSQNARAVRDNDGRVLHFEGMVVDITARKCAEERLLHHALHDPLTGLPNRSLFFHRLDDAINRCRQSDGAGFALLFIDCDRFKLINDSLGHLAGDRLLVLLGHRIAGCLRKSDTLARLGGDEFAVLIEEAAGPGTAVAIAERLHEACRRPIALEDGHVFVSVSIGIAPGSRGYESPSEVLRDADTAMFRAKAKGRGATAVFERGMHLEAVGRLQIETELRHALERNEMRVYYQPIWALPGKRIAGFEALVRWQHSERGLVPPGEFIPIAEETGLIVPLGECVLREACAQLAAWRRQFGGSAESLFMSVNLAAAQLDAPDLVDRAATILADAGLDGQQLKLEVTETAMMANPKEVQAKLKALHGLGIRLCIDDFGTGYSSLSQLRAYPFETLKIDQSFISRIGSGPDSLELVRTIIMLGRNLHLSVVAEGVETALQWDWLIAAGCTYAQGFFLARPLDAGSATAMLRRERAQPQLLAVNS